MRSILLIALACGQVLAVAQEPTYREANFRCKDSYRESYKQLEFEKNRDMFNWGSACAVVAVSGTTFALVTLQDIFTPQRPAKPFIAATAAGAITFACFSLWGDDKKGEY
jgi:cell division protein FtsI/penicillin-binding protein 2